MKTILETDRLYLREILDNDLMEKNQIKCVTGIFTIYFEDPFWVGILEENYNSINYMAKHIFGVEPSNSELLKFYVCEFDRLKKIKIGETNMKTKKMSFKKSLNKAKKIQDKTGVGTKSQNLFQKAFEETMDIKKKERKAVEIIDKDEKYKKKQKMKLEKKKGH